MKIDLGLEPQDFQSRLQRAVEAELENILTGQDYQPTFIGEPDWTKQDEIEAYIAELRSQGSDLATDSRELANRTNQVSNIKATVQSILEEAMQALNTRAFELRKDISRLSTVVTDNSEKTREANRRLAELLAKKEELERLAVLEGTVRDLCEDFEAWHKARPYQVDGILAAVSAYIRGKTGFLDADDMGLGKTFKSAVLMYIIRALFIQKHGREPMMLWVTKKSLIKSNMKEIKRWFPDHKIVPMLPDYAKTLDTREQFFDIALTTGSMMLCSYEHVRTTDRIQETDWDIVFADEVHKLKGGAQSRPTAVWETMKTVCRRAKFMYFLSGTPIVNKAEEMWSYLHIFAPEEFPSVKNFLYKFTDSEWDHKTNGVIFKVNTDRLMHALEGQMIHRSKLEVGMELPSKDRQTLFLEMEEEQEKWYAQMRDRMFVMLDGDKMVSASIVIAHINRLRQIALCPSSLKIEDKETGETWQIPAGTPAVKIDQCVDMLNELDGEQVVVFSAQFNEPLLELGRRLTHQGKSWRIIDGAHSNFTEEYESGFQQGQFDVLMINMRTGSEGLNLQKSPEAWPGGASHAIFLDLWWNPASNIQAEDRIWRDGAVEPCMIHVLQCENSADQYVAAIIEEKAGLINPIMNDQRLRPASEWRELLEGLV